MVQWSRLVRGSTPQKKRPVNASGPQIRLAQLKRAYNGLLVSLDTIYLSPS